MPELRARRTLLALALVVPGCFGEPPSTGGGNDGPTDGSEGSSSLTDPIETDASDTTAGSVGGSGDSSGESGEPCDEGDPECVEPGDAIWTVELGQTHNDGAYAIAVEGEDVFVVGEEGAPSGSTPWMARLALANGDVVWSEATPSNEGVNVLRGVVPAAGSVAAVGSVAAGDSGVFARLEVRDAMGSSLASTDYNYTTVDFLLGAAVASDGLWAVGYSSHIAGDELPFPLLMRYRTASPSAWTVDFSSNEFGQLELFEGALFDVAFTPAGEIVAVGYSGNTAQDASMALFGPSGDLIDNSVALGGEFDDGFIGVAIDDDGSGVAVGRDGTGTTTSDLFIVHFVVEGGITVGEQQTWGEAPFSIANGFARDGDTLFIAAGTSDDPMLLGPSFESLILRWDGDESEPTWAVPFASPSPGRDYASDVALAPDGTLVACGVMTPDGSDNGNIWVRRLAR